jgi:hypothetical protein
MKLKELGNTRQMLDNNPGNNSSQRLEVDGITAIGSMEYQRIHGI